MKRLPIFLAVLAVSTAVFGADPVKASVDDLIKNPAKFDGKVVKVEGVVDKYEERTSKKGNPYTVFKLKGKVNFVSIYMQSHPAKGKSPVDGAKVVVTGFFVKEKKLGNSTYKNEIDASADKKDPKAPRGIQVIKK